MSGNVLLPIVSLLVGWVALLPVRRRVGVVMYHVAAMPVGMLGWAWMSVWGGVFGLAFTWPYALVAQTSYALLVAAALLFLTGKDASGHPEERPFPPWTYLAALVLLGLFAWLVARSGVSMFTADSWADYELMGMWLHDTGDLTFSIVAIRNVLMPSLHAGARMMGSDWLYAIYPVMGLLVCLLVADEIYVRGVPKVGRLWAGSVAVAVTLLMATTAPFLMQSLYIHSHMASALYLTLSIIAIGRARAPGRIVEGDGGDDSMLVRRAWFAVAGLAASGLVLTRPDGLAYVVVPLAVFFVAWIASDRSTGSLATVLVTTFALPMLVFGLTMLRFGLWVQEDKLNGVQVLVLLLAYVLAALVAWALPRWRSATTWLAEGSHAEGLILSLGALAFAVASIPAREDFGLAIGYMARNLVHRGGYNSLWVFAFGLLVLLAVFPDLRKGLPTHNAMVAFILYFMVAATVHGLTHVGRASWGDSFSRAAFHVVPLVFMLLGYVTGEVLEGVLPLRAKT